jgi:hypothetical protein
LIGFEAEFEGKGEKWVRRVQLVYGAFEGLAFCDSSE